MGDVISLDAFRANGEPKKDVVFSAMERIKPGEPANLNCAHAKHDGQHFDYPEIVRDSLRYLVFSVLSEVQNTTLPSKSSLWIEFDTTYPGVEIPQYLRDQYPDRMVINLDNWFKDLEVDRTGFHISLNFSDNVEPLYIPFMSLTRFQDSGSGFGMRMDEPSEPQPTPPSAA